MDGMNPPPLDDEDVGNEGPDVRARRAGYGGVLERMDREEWPDAHTPFARAVRHNIVNMYQEMLTTAAWAYDGHLARLREADLRSLLIGSQEDREREVDEGGAIGRIERKLDRIVVWVKWSAGILVGVAGVYATWKSVHP